MLDITEPLRLSVGNNVASGSGCAMNLVSWTNGDFEITDYPKCSDRVLAQLVQNFNDTCCRCSIPRETYLCGTHGEIGCGDCTYEDDWGYEMMTRPGEGEEGETICAEHAVIAIGLGFRTVGTGGWIEINGYGVWLDIANEFAPTQDHRKLEGIIESDVPFYPYNVGWSEMGEAHQAEVMENWKTTQIREYIATLFDIGRPDEDSQSIVVASINAVIDAFYRHTELAPEPVETERINEAARKMASA